MGIFRATFLGHHGWVFETDDARILVDPLLHDRFGFTDSAELRVYPPRTVDLASFPPIDAVFLTHEHEGHFDIASLNHLDRRVPLYLSSRSSVAMRKLFEEMGFTPHLTYPGVAVEIGDLELFPATGDQVRHGSIEEWDVLPYLVRDLGGSGSLFTNVDLHPTDSMWKSARERIDRPGQPVPHPGSRADIRDVGRQAGVDSRRGSGLGIMISCAHEANTRTA